MEVNAKLLNEAISATELVLVEITKLQDVTANICIRLNKEIAIDKAWDEYEAARNNWNASKCLITTQTPDVKLYYDGCSSFNEEAELRLSNPAVKEAWEKYQVILKLNRK